MGKAEQYKIARKMLKEEQMTLEKQYRNKMLLTGFVAGVIVTALFSALFLRGGASPSTTALPDVATNSAILASPVAIPSGITLPIPSTTAAPLQLQQ